MDLVDEMFSVFKIKPKIVDERLYNIVTAKLYVEGYISLSELLEYMDFVEAYSVLYWVAKRLFPYIGIIIDNPDVDEKQRGEIILFTKVSAVSKHICRKLASDGGTKLLESIAEEIESRLSGRPHVKDKALGIIRVLIEVCRRELSNKTTRRDDEVAAY